MAEWSARLQQWRLIMSVQETSEIRELTLAELDSVEGGMNAMLIPSAVAEAVRLFLVMGALWNQP
jgi:hypothetical protein